jgi:hypothetical protein
LHRPDGAAFGRRRAGQGDQAGLGAAVEREFAAGAVLRLADQSGLQALLDESLSDPLDSGDANLSTSGMNDFVDLRRN